MKKIPIVCSINKETNCWEVKSHKPFTCGYVYIRKDGKVRRLHRVVYEEEKGHWKHLTK